MNKTDKKEDKNEEGVRTVKVDLTEKMDFIAENFPDEYSLGTYQAALLHLITEKLADIDERLLTLGSELVNGKE